MASSSKKTEPASRITFWNFLLSYFLPGLGLLALSFVSAVSLPADVLGLGSFLCFFTLAVTLIVEGLKRLCRKTPSDGDESA